MILFFLIVFLSELRGIMHDEVFIENNGYCSILIEQIILTTRCHMGSNKYLIKLNSMVENSSTSWNQFIILINSASMGYEQ